MRILCTLLILIGASTARADDLEDRLYEIENSIRWNEVLIQTAQPIRNGYDRTKDMSIPEWQRTGCKTHPEVINGQPMSVCDGAQSFEEFAATYKPNDALVDNSIQETELNARCSFDPAHFGTAGAADLKAWAKGHGLCD